MNRVWAIAVGLLACCCCRDAGEASCWMRPGDEVTRTQTWSEVDLTALTLYDQVDVTWRWDSSQDVSVTWTGPEHLLDFASAEWDGQHLMIGHSDRCEWARRLDLVVKAEIVSGTWEMLALRGQGTFVMDSVWRGGRLAVDAFASSSVAELRVDADTLTVKLHAGPTAAQVLGQVDVLEAYSSGLGALDASVCQVHKAFINQSGVIPLQFSAIEYAYVGIHSPGDAIIHGGWPNQLTLVTTSTGELFEQ